MEQEKTNFKQIGKTIGIFLLYLIFLPAICLTIFGIANKDFNTYSLIKQNLLYLGAETTLALIICFIFRKQFINDLKTFKNNFKSNIKSALKYLGIGMLLMMLANFLINIVFFQGSLAANEELNRTYLQDYPLYAITTFVVLAPLVEELIFRLNVRNALKNNLVFLITSTLLFAATHLVSSNFSYVQLLYLIPYSALGWAFAKTYVKTNNVLYSIIIHSIQNSISVGIILLSMI